MFSPDELGEYACSLTAWLSKRLQVRVKPLRNSVSGSALAEGCSGRSNLLLRSELFSLF